MSKYGIDVSYAQARIDWEQVATDKEFAIVRAGYGSNNIDRYADYNVTECNRVGLPVGIYWFSYAYTAEMARLEAEYAVAFAQNMTLDLPIFWDFEYDSEEYAREQGVTITTRLYHEMADAFCTAVELGGRDSGLYYNPDFDSRYRISDFFINYPARSKWVAKWSSMPPDSYEIWQYGLGTAGSVPGISTDVDLDVIEDDTPIPPVPPTPPVPTRKMPIWFYLRPY